MTIEQWVQGQVPPVPEAFRPALSSAEEATFDGLLNAARTEFERAREGRGRDRDQAFHLLAADAYLTYACAAVLEGGSPDSGEVTGEAAVGLDVRSELEGIVRDLWEMLP